jgi:outer membrane usher protein
MRVRSNSRFAVSPAHDSRCQTSAFLHFAGIFLLVLAVMPRLAIAAEMASSAAGDQTLLLDVQLNGYSTGKIGEFTLRHGQLMARLQELHDLGLRVSIPRAMQSGHLVALSDVSGLSCRLDQKKQELFITAGDGLLLPAVLQSGSRGEPDGRRVIESGTGMTLNYDTVGTYAGGQAGASGSLDFRAFSRWGVVSSEWLAYGGATSSGEGTNTAIRLDSTYEFGDANTLRRYSLGDFVTSGLSWTRPVHMEGAQIRSDFSMRPDLITFPLPSLGGSAAVPSTVDVLTNGNLVISSDVNAGPFEVPQLPVVTGAGSVSMTVTNALGQQVNVTQSFYASSALLAPGLQTFAGQAGLVRRNWGSIGNDYGKIAGSAMYRRGLTPRFTVESSLEGTPGAVKGGAGGVAQIGNLGIVNFAVATSLGAGHPGAQFSAGAQRIGRVFSLGASAIVAGRNYRDVAAMNGAPVQRKQLSANAGLSLRRFGSMGVAYAGISQDSTPNPIPGDITPAQRSHVVSANYSFQLHRMSFYASEFRDLGSSGSSNGLQIGVTIPFGRRGSVGVSATTDGSGQVQAQQSAPQIGDWGYQLYTSDGNSSHEFGQLQYKSHAGLLTAGIDRNAGLTTLRLETQGAVSWVDGGVFPSNTIYDSFAIVDTSPMQGVHVLQENRDVGTTNSSGRLLVPDMRSFDRNQISIEAIDVPADATLGEVTHVVRPQDLSGVVIKFAVKFSDGALLRLVDEVGTPLPVGSTATLVATGAAIPVGYDGDAYVEALKPRNELAVELPDGRRCKVAFDYRPVPGEIPRIGPLRCVEAAQ